MKKAVFWVAAAAILCLSAPAPAQDPDSIKGAVGAPKDETKGMVGGDLNFGQIDEDWYTTIHLGFSMDLGKIGFGVQIPLRLRIHDADPTDESESVFREEDWDEWTDYLKIIRFFRFGHKGDFIYVVVGDLPGATIGHGTIVNRYYNNVDLDHYKMGVVADLNTDYGGLETLLNAGFVTNMFALRGYIRPWSFVDKESYLNNFAVGFTVAADVTAPYTLAAIETDKEYNLPPVDVEETATVMGGDIEFKLLDTSFLTVTPYMDLNGIPASGGVGYHAGILSVFHIGGVALDLQAKLEYRYFTGDYIPAYFNSYYEIQKFAYPYWDNQNAVELRDTKRKVLELLPDQGLNGYYAELAFSFLGLFTIGASYDDYDGKYNSNLRIYLDVPALEVFQFGAYYYKHNFEGAGEAFTFDEKSLFLLEARYQISSFLYVVGQYWRIWQLDNNPTIDDANGQPIDNPEYGTYVAVDDWSVGLGVSYTF
ncbi:hypothetical protein ACFL2F_03220 [Myxococcota bacterium]